MAEMDIKIRRARADEAGILTDLSMRSKRSNGYDEAFMTACRRELTITEAQLNAGEYWVAEADIVCGCAGLRADPDRRSGEVHTFFVDPRWKRKGIGRLLWQKLVERANAKGLTTLRLDADPFAVPFYTALGFKTVGDAPSGSIEGRRIPHMTIALEPSAQSATSFS